MPDMNRKEFNKIKKDFKRYEKRLKSLKVGEFIYEQEIVDPLGFSFFKHEVVSIDLNEMCVNTLDHSLNKKSSKLSCFFTAEEVNIKS